MTALDEAADFHEWAEKLPPVEREIAAHLHGQQGRLLGIAKTAPDGITERLQGAIEKAKDNPTSSRLEALGREILRQRNDDDVTALTLLLT